MHLGQVTSLMIHFLTYKVVKNYMSLYNYYMNELRKYMKVPLFFKTLVSHCAGFLKKVDFIWKWIRSSRSCSLVREIRCIHKSLKIRACMHVRGNTGKMPREFGGARILGLKHTVFCMKHSNSNFKDE